MVLVFYGKKQFALWFGWESRGLVGASSAPTPPEEDRDLLFLIVEFEDGFLGENSFVSGCLELFDPVGAFSTVDDHDAHSITPGNSPPSLVGKGLLLSVVALLTVGSFATGN